MTTAKTIQRLWFFVWSACKSCIASRLFTAVLCGLCGCCCVKLRPSDTRELWCFNSAVDMRCCWCRLWRYMLFSAASCRFVSSVTISCASSYWKAVCVAMYWMAWIILFSSTNTMTSRSCSLVSCCIFSSFFRSYSSVSLSIFEVKRQILNMVFVAFVKALV